MQRLRLLIAATIVMCLIGSTGATAAPGSATTGASVWRYTTAQVSLAPSGFLYFQYVTITGTAAGLDTSAGPFVYPPVETTAAVVDACGPSGCIFGSITGGTPAHPHDPLLQGGLRLFQVIVDAGPPGCEGTVVTVAFNGVPNGSPSSHGYHDAELDADRPDAAVTSEIRRPLALTGSISSCLGGFSFVPSEAVGYTGHMISGGAYGS